ncbi:MAG: helix-turn-helix domain-containing protein [Prochloraceae cyanobacterium]
MGYTIARSCFGCGICRKKCPTNAIKFNQETYQIEADLCNCCQGYYPDPQCIVSCPNSSPVPLHSKKGRYKAHLNIAGSHELFVNGHNNALASSIVIWESCNLLTSAKILPWKSDTQGQLYYQRPVKQGKGAISFQLTHDLQSDAPHLLKEKAALCAISSIDLRAACLHLIYAAYATFLDHPWEEDFILNDSQIEKYLGLDKRKDLTKATKLTLIKTLAQQPCQIITSINWPQQGKVPGFSITQSRLWHLLEIKHHFQEDSLGYKHLVGLTFRLRPGIWARYFLNKQGYKERNAFYQYGTLPKFVLNTVITIWQQHEGAARMILWLLFKTKMGKEQRITVTKLMQVAYGNNKINQAYLQREVRKRLLRTFESDLEILSHYGIKPVFDPVTYPREIQPLWAKLAALPDDADAAVEFWINDANSNQSLTDSSPPGKWDMLMKARILSFELPLQWQEKLTKLANKKQRRTRQTHKSKTTKALNAEQILAARKSQGISQRNLAEKMGKSQSWIRDLESGRLSPKPEDRIVLQKLLEVLD